TLGISVDPTLFSEQSKALPAGSTAAGSQSLPDPLTVLQSLHRELKTPRDTGAASCRSEEAVSNQENKESSANEKLSAIINESSADSIAQMIMQPLRTFRLPSFGTSTGQAEQGGAVAKLDDGDKEQSSYRRRKRQSRSNRSSTRIAADKPSSTTDAAEKAKSPGWLDRVLAFTENKPAHGASNEPATTPGAKLAESGSEQSGKPPMQTGSDVKQDIQSQSQAEQLQQAIETDRMASASAKTMLNESARNDEKADLNANANRTANADGALITNASPTNLYPTDGNEIAAHDEHSAKQTQQQPNPQQQPLPLSGAFTMQTPSILNARLSLVTTVLSALKTKAGEQSGKPEEPEDPWKKRLLELSEQGTSSLNEGEAFMFSEETGEATLFLPDGKVIRRIIAQPRDHQEIARLRRPDMLIPEEIMYNLSLFAKLLPKDADSPASAPVSESNDNAEPAPKLSAVNILGSSEHVVGWLKSLFKF
ncbi:MAG TPA: hypothetical protein V6D17_21610, partial [Candidatus Obscuribacterales bacterium]